MTATKVTQPINSVTRVAIQDPSQSPNPGVNLKINSDGSINVVSESGDTIQITPYAGTITQTLVTLTAATSAQLIAANATRKGLRWMNTGTNPMTVVPGAGPAVAGSGMNYNGSTGAGFQGGSEAFEGSAVPTGAYQAISTLGTTVTVWEMN